MIDVCFVYFRSLTLDHLDASWYSLSKQDFSNVGTIYFLDNNTDDSEESIVHVLQRYPLPRLIKFESCKHGDLTKTHSWTVNRLCRDSATNDTVFFLRADYILAFNCLQRLEVWYDNRPDRFVSGWCWQMSYDREARLTEPIDIERFQWRKKGMPALLQHPFAFKFFETDLDAGIWLTSRVLLAKAGWMNEAMVSWGYQQSTFQRAITRADGTCITVPEYLFAHQHHDVVRDFAKAREEYDLYGEGQ